MKFYSEIHGVQMMNPDDSAGPFPLVPPTSQNLYLYS